MSLKLYQNNQDVTEVGCDEVGAGCLAGPVYAACVIWNPLIYDEMTKQIKDSKLLSEKKRKQLADYIKENAIDYSIGICTVEEIDTLNILQARIKAMHKALDGLSTDFDMILVDGTHFNPYFCKKHQCIIKGDSKYVSIAAASIIAKVARDDYMTELAKTLAPEYKIEQNKGYGTKDHINAINSLGFTSHHRKTFEPIKTILKKIESI